MKPFIKLILAVVIVLLSAVSAHAESAGKLQKVGLNYYYSGHYGKAIDYFKQALEITRKRGRQESIAILLSNIGRAYKSWGRYDKAIDYYLQGLEIERKLGDKVSIVISLNDIGTVYNYWGRYDKAIDYYQQALEMGNKIGDKAGITLSLNNIGAVYKSWGRYDEAIDYFKQALEIGNKIGNKAGIATFLNNIGMVYKSWGRYDKAIDYYQQALEIHRKLGDKAGIAISLNNIGTVHNSWGRYDKAIDYYQQALEIHRKLGDKAGIAISLNNIGMVYKSWSRYDKAIDYFKQALEINRKLRNKTGIALSLNNIGAVYKSWGRYDEAIDYYQQGLEIDRKLGDKAGIAISLNNIGFLYYSWGLYDKAIDYYQQGLEIHRKLRNKEAIATFLNNIGYAYRAQKEYSSAIKYFEKSVALKENLRKTAKGDMRRDYLSSQLYTYQALISSYVKGGQPIRAFEAMELSRAKVLAERLAGSGKDVPLPPVFRIKKGMGDSTALLAYTIVDDFEIVQVGITQGDIQAKEVKGGKYLARALKKYNPAINQHLKGRRGIKITKKKEEKLPEKVEKKDDLENLINYYRYLLMSPSQKNDEAMREISRLLYDFLVKPMTKEIEGKKDLIIIPDGVLAFLPFETLMDEDGRYLVERYNITYVQSMGVMALIKERRYKAGRKPMLAFGGALYDNLSYNVDMVRTEAQLKSLEKSSLLAMNINRSLSDAYASLGMAKWNNLPGTLTEVRAIAAAVEGSKIVTGRDVNEGKVKALSASGDLASYKVVHFATHGLVVPEFPELSAIVLSQFKDRQSKEDGYLRMGEVARLNLRADFVNLSACETGLGKIFGGEGVVGLTQSFLIAGANGLSVSLWPVADQSTMIFMVGVYQLVNEKGMSYGQAINEMKRAFMRGQVSVDGFDPSRGINIRPASGSRPTKLSHPYYWAPFVYYGK